MGIREGKWRCPYCAVVNRGADIACTGCGATRDKDVAFFVEEEAPEVQDAALLARAEAGADWLCLFCQTSNRPEATSCANCGAGRGSAPSRKVEDVPLPPPPRTPPPPAAPPAARGGSGCGLAVVLGLLVVAFVSAFGAYWLFFRRTEDRARITRFEWERTIEVEALRSVREKAWQGEVPGGGREVSRSREVHHTDHVAAGTQRVKVGTKNLGNGFFKDVYEDRPVYKDQPVYRDRITYDIDRWVTDRKVAARGEDQSPTWPTPTLLARERDGPHAERYTVILDGPSKDARLDLPYLRWAALKAGERVTVVFRGTRLVDLAP